MSTADSFLRRSLVAVGANFLQGSAYVFTKSGSQWSQQAELVSSDGAQGDFFGSSVSDSTTTAAMVGAPLKTINGNTDQGAAYFFQP